MELTMQEKLRLIDFFEFQLDKEVSKPLDEMDTGAIDAYVNVLLDLQDKHIELSPDFITEQVRKIFRKEEKTAHPEAVKTTKKYFNKKKVWLVAACIAILVALFSIISVANDWNVFDFLSEKFGSVHSAPIEEEQNFNGVSVFVNGKTTTYSDIEDALKIEKLDVLYPTFLPDDIEITEIMFYDKKSIHKMIYLYTDSNLYSEICFDSHLTQSTKAASTEIITINSVDLYIFNMPDISSVQIEFEYAGNTYFFSYTDKDALIEIIKNLEEIDNEN